MHSSFVRFICRILITSMLVLPFQAQADVIGTDQAAAAAARASVAGFLDRDEVAGQLQALGLSPQAARERVATLSDAEVASLAGRIEALPAGGVAGLMLLIAVVLVAWYAFIVPATTVKEAAKPKPAPEKK